MTGRECEGSRKRNWRQNIRLKVQSLAVFKTRVQRVRFFEKRVFDQFVCSGVFVYLWVFTHYCGAAEQEGSCSYYPAIFVVFDCVWMDACSDKVCSCVRLVFLCLSVFVT